VRLLLQLLRRPLLWCVRNRFNTHACPIKVWTEPSTQKRRPLAAFFLQVRFTRLEYQSSWRWSEANR
jgi:hypothetical protein